MEQCQKGHANKGENREVKLKCIESENNLYALLTTDPTNRPKVTSTFQQAIVYGLTIAHAWDFNNGNAYRTLQTSPGVYEEKVFRVCNLMRYIQYIVL
jgi:hypothetical protein